MGLIPNITRINNNQYYTSLWWNTVAKLQQSSNNQRATQVWINQAFCQSRPSRFQCYCHIESINWAWFSTWLIDSKMAGALKQTKAGRHTWCSPVKTWLLDISIPTHGYCLSSATSAQAGVKPFSSTLDPDLCCQVHITLSSTVSLDLTHVSTPAKKWYLMSQISFLKEQARKIIH